MTPVQAIAQLDRQIAKSGETVTLRRFVPNQPAIEKPHRAFVRGYRPDELVGGIFQGDSLVVMSPTKFPAEFADFSNPADNALRLKTNEGILISGRRRTVQYVDPVRMNGVVVRVNVLVR